MLSTVSYTHLDVYKRQLWNRNYIDYVEITAVENLGIEQRGGFYETAGALRDMVQNHLIQLVALDVYKRQDHSRQYMAAFQIEVIIRTI